VVFGEGLPLVLDNMIGSRYDRQARCAVPCCFLVNSKCHIVSSDSEDEPESLLEEISSLTRSGGNEGLDVWQKFLQPLTPPLSPVKSHSECSSSNFPGSSVSERLQSVCDSLDAFSNDKLQPSNSETYLKTKLISDCMWNGQRDRCLSNASDIDLFPTPVATPCSSPPPVDCILPSNSNCVDPIAVFPMGVTADHQSVSSLSDSEEEEIDVVSVDSMKPPPKLKIKLVRRSPKKRSLKVSHSTFPSHNTQPECKRRKISSSKPKIKQPAVPKQQIILTCSIVPTKPEPLPQKDSHDNYEWDDLEPGAKRASHNVLERKRRIDLKRSFETLRAIVPNLEKQEKTPKVLVLQRATMHITNLKHEEDRCLKIKRQLQEKRQTLIGQLASLINVNSVKLELND